MAINRKKSGGGGGANWMDTYGDMVTLLLCFFVLLYSMSTISEDKWKAIVLSFNPNAIIDQQEIEGNKGGPLSDPENEGTMGQIELAEQQEEIEAAIMALYETLKEYAEQSADGQSIDVTKGDGYVFVSFNEAVFFAGDKSDLLPAGQKTLQLVSDALSAAAPYLDEVRVMGHTAQALKDTPNEARGDRFLASDRATTAAVYIQEHSTVHPSRIVVESFGQWRPVSGNDSEGERKLNRRVEMMVTGRDVYSTLGDSLEQYYSLQSGTAHLTSGEH